MCVDCVCVTVQGIDDPLVSERSELGFPSAHSPVLRPGIQSQAENHNVPLSMDGRTRSLCEHGS